MGKTIVIVYLLSDKATTVTIKLQYVIERAENLQTITCTVVKGGDSIPLWLHPHKFDVKSILVNGIYETMFNFDNDTKSLDATLFIDQAYAEIMAAEHLLVV